MQRSLVSTNGTIKSTINSRISNLLINDNTIIPDGLIPQATDGSLTLAEIINDILFQNRNALFDDVRVAGLLKTEYLSIDNSISIGDTSGSTYQVLQFIRKDNFKENPIDQVINNESYEIINDISLSFRAKNSNSYYQLGITFNNLTSTYYNTFLKIGVFYYTTITDLGIDSDEKLIGEYVIGSENTNFTSGIFSKTVTVNILHAANDTVHFYLKGKIQTDKHGNDFDYADLDDELKPKIIQTLSGNLITASEFAYFT
tara:strand:+ start:549 stop:1322 length:774 start_codon:yes stop_codon:yes gene_type:complete